MPEVVGEKRAQYVEKMGEDVQTGKDLSTSLNLSRMCERDVSDETS